MRARARACSVGAGKIRQEQRPQNWVVLLYDDEESECNSPKHCPTGCHQTATTCSGTPQNLRGFQAAWYAIRHDNKLPYRENGQVKAGPEKELTCADFMAAAGERFPVKWATDGGYMYGPESRFIQNKRRDRAFYAVLATDDCTPLKAGVTWRIHFANGGASTRAFASLVGR